MNMKSPMRKDVSQYTTSHYLILQDKYGRLSKVFSPYTDYTRCILEKKHDVQCFILLD